MTRHVRLYERTAGRWHSRLLCGADLRRDLEHDLELRTARRYPHWVTCEACRAALEDLATIAGDTVPWPPAEPVHERDPRFVRMDDGDGSRGTYGQESTRTWVRPR